MSNETIKLVIDGKVTQSFSNPEQARAAMYRANEQHPRSTVFLQYPPNFHQVPQFRANLAG